VAGTSSVRSSIGLDHAVAISGHDDVDTPLCLVEVAHGREVALLVDDPSARAVEIEAREDNRLGDGDVLVHRDGPGRSADQPTDLVADGQRQLPPALAPGANAPRVPVARVAEDALLGGRGHRPERVVDQVGRLREDREALAVVEEFRHRARV